MHAATAPIPEATDARANISILMLTLAAFAVLTTEFIILGILPGLAQDLDISIAKAGQLVSVFALTVMLVGPFLTAAISHWDRKKLFIGILIIFAVSNALSALATGFWAMALSRVLAAALLPVFWGTASESAAQLAGKGNEGKAVARVYLGITAAFVFGIPLGTLAANALGWRGTFWLISGLCLAIALLMWALLPQLPTVPKRPAGERQTVILKDPGFVLHVLLSVVVFSAMFTAYTYLADILERLAHVPAAQVGWWLMGFGAVGMLGNAVGGRLVDRSPLGATILLLIALGVGMAGAAPAVDSTWLLVVALAAWGIAYTALFPVCQVRVMIAGARAQALAGTLNVSAANGGIAVGAAIGGATIEHLGLATLGWVGAAIALLAVALATALLVRDLGA
ncbi:MFS transporter [Pseudomonas sp. PSKL.D1]|uniref:MFS transporter n=1 Tax=Pseudomonas sp. PSKL.D1 TaxID=3029060 RepID=UPI0023810571|nr:MFS transporter [Pseudomonas sp. PSKL.D1]WDY59952.1 MFS transporter [Pseudomonas sp. PSKL.D1]